MFIMKARLRRMFCKAFMKKKSRYSLPSHITLNNCIPHEKNIYIYVRGTINIGHCRGHHCIVLIFISERFYEDHSRLL